MFIHFFPPSRGHGRRSLVGCSPWGRKESDTTELLHFHFSLSCIGEGNGNPLQCSCLENPRDGGAWWAAFSGVAQSRTRLKRLSSSSSRRKVARLTQSRGCPEEVDLDLEGLGWHSRIRTGFLKKCCDWRATVWHPVLCYHPRFSLLCMPMGC